jgi:ATP phosphoribosyltransferase regulatory subunit
MGSKAAQRAELARLSALFEAAGAVTVDADILQSAEVLLDLYGEDIRARAYVTSDPVRGEQMLRPDFTIPVVEMHMAHGAEPARYTYAGEVFRRQEEDDGRPSEYFQVGYEVFDRADPAAADAEVFALIAGGLSHLGLHAATGDIGLLTAAVAGLSTSERRRAALMRHIWRPQRFRALLDRFGGRAPMPSSRLALLADPDPLARAEPLIGLRGLDEIAARIAALRQDAAEPPVPAGEVDLLEELLAIRATTPVAMELVRDIAGDLPSIRPALRRMEARVEAMARRGVAVDRLDFEAAYGRTAMEYYDGFVFGFYADSRPDLPPVATGGRYDALTRVLGRGKSIPAVGGVIRPDLVVQLTEARP